MSKQEEIIEVCGKKVVVRYTRDGAPCEKCVFDSYTGCKYNHADCSRLDRVGMEIDERAYFVEAEQPEEETPAREANPFVPDQGLTIDGKRYVKRYFRIGDACSRCAFKVGEDAKGHARCKDHGKPEKPCTPDREKGVLVYFIAAEADVNRWAVTNAFLHCEKAGKIVSEMYGDKFNNSRNRDKYLAFLQQVNLDDRFGELADLLRKYRAMPVEENVDTQVVEALSGEVSENIIGQIKANIDAQKAAEKPEIIFSTDGELTVYSFVGAPRWWATIREAEEALSVFKAGIAYERERLMKDAVEIDTDITINRYTKQHILHISSTDEHIQHLPQGEYKAIIIKKEK